METGLYLGLMAYVSTMFLWWNSPAVIKRFTLHHPIVTDVFVGLLTHFTMSYMSKSIASMVAATVVGILMQVTLTVLERPWARTYLGLQDPPTLTWKNRAKAALSRKTFREYEAWKKAQNT